MIYFLAKSSLFEELQIDEGIDKKIVLCDYNMLDELKNIQIKIPLPQPLKEITIFPKEVKELCIENPIRK